jgi:hypothetical protein
VGTELAARGLHRGVDLPGGHPEAFGDELEVVDQGLHRLAHDVLDVVHGIAQPVSAESKLRGPGDLLVLDHDRPGSKPVQALLNYLE